MSKGHTPDGSHQRQVTSIPRTDHYVMSINDSLTLVAGQDDPVMDFLERAVNVMSIYYTLALLVSGCVCNCLTIAVLSRPAFRGTSMAIYFRFLSVMDLAALITGLSRFFQISAFGLDVRNDTTSCRVNFWIMNVFLFSSSWTLISVTSERVLSIVTPHKVKLICSTGRINKIIVAIFLGMAVINAPIFYLLGTLEESNPATNVTLVRFCTVVVERDTVRPLFWWFESTMFAFVPCVILLFFNLIILKGVMDSRRKLKKMKMKSTTSSSVSATTTNTNTNATNSGSDSTEVFNKGDNNNNSNKKNNKVSSLTVTLLCINMSFIVCNFPICVYQVTPFQQQWQVSRGSIVMVQFFLMLMYTNNALNFLLYCITGSKFRSELSAMLGDLYTRLITCRDVRKR